MLVPSLPPCANKVIKSQPRRRRGGGEEEEVAFEIFVFNSFGV